MTNRQGNVEGIKKTGDTDEDRLKLRSQCIHVLLNRFGSVDINEVFYNTQDIYECADTWVSQGNEERHLPVVSYLISTLTLNKKDV